MWGGAVGRCGGSDGAWNAWRDFVERGAQVAGSAGWQGRGARTRISCPTESGSSFGPCAASARSALAASTRALYDEPPAWRSTAPSPPTFMMPNFLLGCAHQKRGWGGVPVCSHRRATPRRSPASSGCSASIFRDVYAIHPPNSDIVDCCTPGGGNRAIPGGDSASHLLPRHPPPLEHRGALDLGQQALPRRGRG